MSCSTTYDDCLHHVIVYFPETDMTGFEDCSKDMVLTLDCRYIMPGDLSLCLSVSSKYTYGIGYIQTFKKVNSNVYIDVLHYGDSMYITEPYYTFGKFEPSDMEKHYYIPKKGTTGKRTTSDT